MSDDAAAARPADRAGVVRETDRPATFRDVFAVREYRALYLAMISSWVGDYLSRAAVTVLVFQQTRSVLLSAASFAISYLPWIAGGPVLAALAERYPYRRVIVVCDLLRMALMALLIIPGLPIALLLVLVFLAMLASPPSQAARSALLPLLLGRDRLVIALAATSTTMQAAQVVGYLAGATLAAAVNPRLAILTVAVAFGGSALLTVTGVRARPAARSGGPRTHLLRETAEGFRVVLGDHVLRPIALMAIALTIFAIVPEGLAAAWAAQANPDPSTRVFDQGMIMAAGPVGFVIGGVLFSRFIRPALRQRVVRPLAILAPLVLVPAVTAPSAQVVALLTMLSGVAQGGLIPALNSQFALSLAHGYRARAFAVVQGGMQLAQCTAVLTTGVLAEHWRVPTVVGLWSVGGTLLMAALVVGWPTPAVLEQSVATAAAYAPPEPDAPASGDAEPTGGVKAAAEPAEPTHGAPPAGDHPAPGDRGKPINGSAPGISTRPSAQAARITPDHR